MTTRQYRRSRATAAGSETPLHHLNEDLKRHQARARRARRQYQARTSQPDWAAATSPHQVWSDAIADALQTAEAISKEQPHDLGELLTQYEAIWWWINEDDNVVDGSSRRWLGRFRRSLRRLVANT